MKEKVGGCMRWSIVQSLLALVGGCVLATYLNITGWKRAGVATKFVFQQVLNIQLPRTY